MQQEIANRFIASEKESRPRGMKIFWISLPLLIALPAIGIRELCIPLFVAYAGLAVLLGLIIFFAARRVELSSRERQVEGNELGGIISGLEDALIAYDNDFQVFFFNPAAERLFKLRKEDVLGARLQAQDVEKSERRLLTQVIFPSLAPGMINRSPAGTYPQIVDLSFNDPEELEFRVFTSPINDERKGVVGFMKIIRNRTREALLLKSKTEFLTIASHQLRGPLTNINWALQTLEQSKGVDEAGMGLVKNASKASQELLAIIEDLLNITKIEEGHFGYVFLPTNIFDFIEKILGEAAPQARRASVKLFFEPVPELTIDPQKLSMVLANLLDNAIRYNVENGEVVVKLAKLQDEPFVEITVRDTGIGIPKDQLAKIFTKFFRADNALKFQTEGSGLGLYIAKNIVRAHGGSIWVDSEEKRGTTFHFTLPTDPTLIPSHEAMLEQ